MRLTYLNPLRHTSTLFMVWALIVTALISLQARAEVPFYSFTPKEYRIGADGYYFQTNANYNSRGNTEDLPAGFGYGQYGVNFNGRYTWSKKLSLFSGTSLRYATSENSVDKKSTFNIPFLNLGANFNLGKLYFNVIPEVKVSFPIAKYSESEEDAQTSEGLLTGEVGSHFFKTFSDFMFQTYLGYEYKTEDFASLFHYQFKLYYFYEDFAFMTGFLGFTSVGSDSNNDLSRANFIAQSNGGSMIYNSDEPSRYDIQLQLGYLVSDQTRLFVSGVKSLSGESSVDFYQIHLGMEYRFSGGKKKIIEPMDESTDDAKDEFKFEDEVAPPDFEEEIKTFNKPKMLPKKKILQQKMPKKKTIEQKNQDDFNYDVDESRKKMDRYNEKAKMTQRDPNPKSSTRKSKKLKRIRINF